MTEQKKPGGKLVKPEHDEEIKAVWRRFMADPGNRPAILWLTRMQGLTTPPEAAGADRRIWQDQGARAMAAEIFAMGTSKPAKEGE